MNAFNITFHCYADDTQIYVPIHANGPTQLNQLNKLGGLSEIKRWMCGNILLLNADKTELLVVRPSKCKNSQELIVRIDGCDITESKTVKNLGFIFDSQLNFQDHIKYVTKSAFYHLSNIAKIRSILTKRDAETLIHAFVSSRLDYCNALFSDLPACSLRSLQLVQNAAARVLTTTRRYDYITPVLTSLHWLPIQARADFKILLTYKSLNCLAPFYLADLIKPYTPAQPLRSLGTNLLEIPWSKRYRQATVPFLIEHHASGVTFRYMSEKPALSPLLNQNSKHFFSRHYGPLL